MSLMVFGGGVKAPSKVAVICLAYSSETAGGPPVWQATNNAAPIKYGTWRRNSIGPPPAVNSDAKIIVLDSNNVNGRRVCRRRGNGIPHDGLH